MKRTVNVWQGYRISLPGNSFAPSLLIHRILCFLQRELRKPNAYLLPVRVFIGIGWLRAFTEKFVESGWHNGTSLTTFFTQQLNSDAVAFPFYKSVIFHLFLPHAEVLGYTIMLGELVVGLAILAGIFSSAALLGGIFMNLNFLLAGVPNPTTFYIVIQVALLATRAGAVLGVDTWLSTKLPNSLLVAHAAPRRRAGSLQRRAGLLLAGFALLGAVTAFGYISDFSPAGSVEDPAAVLVVLLFLASAYGVIMFLRAWEPTRG
jgi:thiosulfate dehydrogenase [quinone] large subunit